VTCYIITLLETQVPSFVISYKNMDICGSIIFSVEFGFENIMVVRTNQTH